MQAHPLSGDTDSGFTVETTPWTTPFTPWTCAPAHSLLAAVLNKIWLGTDEYKELAQRIERNEDLLKSLKRPSSVRPELERRAARDIAKLQSYIQADKGSLLRNQGIVNFFPFLLQAANFWLISSLFNGVVFATLPFKPFPFVTMMTHRGLPGEDYTQAGYLFFFALGGMCIRPLVAKLLGGGAVSASNSNPMSAITDLYAKLSAQQEQKEQ